MPIKPLSFKGDKKSSKKRKHPSSTIAHDDSGAKSEVQVTSEDSWTLPSQASDLSGPITIVLPPAPPATQGTANSATSSTTHPSYALATDPNGTVYPSPLHNLIESDPTTAEPDSIQQVWQCHRVPGSSPSSRIEMTLKAPHGAYLAADSGASGALSARREARGVEESWIVEEVGAEDLAGDGEQDEQQQQHTTSAIPDSRRRFRLRTLASSRPSSTAAATTTTEPRPALPVPARDQDAAKGDEEMEGKYMSILYSTGTKLPSLHSSPAGPTDASTHLILRMQTRFKPSATSASAAYSTTGTATHHTASHSTSSSTMSRRELSTAVGRDLNDDEVRRLKRARKEGNFYEEVLDVRVKGKHDKFA